MLDLNTLIPANSPLYIVWAPFIDDQGWSVHLVPLPTAIYTRFC